MCSSIPRWWCDSFNGLSKHYNLTEEDHINFSKEAIKSHSFDQLLQLIEYICDEWDKLLNFKQEFDLFWDFVKCEQFFEDHFNTCCMST